MTVQGTLERLVVAHQSDRGLKRANNEDTSDFRIPAPGTAEAHFGALFVVADGVGSLGSGEHASRAAVETLFDSYYDPELDDEDPRERIIAAIQDANEAVRARGRAFEGQPLGTTLVGAAVLPSGRMVLFNVGDSRVYRVRGRSIEQLTADQSAVDPSSGGERAKLTAYVGQPAPILPQVTEQEFRPGDILVICSDGLWGLVDAADIAKVVRSHTPDLAVARLVKQVYANGARDNVTVMLVHYGRPARKRRLMLVLLVAVVLMLAAGLAAIQLRQGVAVMGPPTAGAAETRVVVPLAVTDSAPQTDAAPGLLVVRTPTFTPN